MKAKKKPKARGLGTAEIDLGVLDQVKKVCKEKGIKIYAYVSNAVSNQLVNDTEGGN